MASGAASGSTGEAAALQQLSDCTEKLAQALDPAGHTAPRSAGMFQG
jgi:hypothetical protein